MNRVRELRRTPLVKVERFDHPEGDEPRDDGDEQASGFALNLVECGAFRVAAGRSLSWATPGAFFCTAPGLSYSCAHPPGPATDSCLTVSFGMGTEDEVFQPARWPARRGLPLLPPTNRRAYAARHLAARLDAPALALESAAAELVAATVADDAAPRRLYRPAQLSWYAARVERARERLDAEYADDHSLAALAREAGMSPFHFAHVFAELVGTPPHRYLVVRRLDVAAKLLREGASVSRAGLACGFASLGHFSRSFRRRYGTAPSRLGRRPS